MSASARRDAVLFYLEDTALKYVIWDWNGTILDDRDTCICCMNVLLEKYGLEPLAGKDDYTARFSFPIENYYRGLGFDFSRTSFAALAKEFIDLYQPASYACPLVKNAEETIRRIHARGIGQVVLSASKQQNLEDQVGRHDIARFFDNLLGIGDVFAKSKVDIGKQWISESGIDAGEITVIGDTAHDYEVAEALGCECILYVNGHQAIDKRQHPRAKFVEDLGELLEIV